MERTGVDLTTELSPFLPAPGPSDEELDALRAWLPARRWFPVKAGLTAIEPWLSVRFADESNTVIHLLQAHGANGTALVHVPVCRRSARPEEFEQHVAQEVGTPAPEPRGLIARLGSDVLLDAFHEDSFWRSWLTLAQWGEGDDGALPDLDLNGAVFITGEQSNSSVIFPNLAGGAILKVFRGLARGPNPDVDVPRALVQTGWEGVPRPLAWLELTWSEQDTGLLDLGVLSEFIAGSSDGFQLACAYASGNQSFASEAELLGRTVAQLHRALAQAIPTDQLVSLEWLRTELRRRARQAIGAEAVLTPRSGAIEAFLNRIGHGLERGPSGSGDTGELLLPLQTIHGDLHLGQALYAQDSGWHILDFEGEPMRPVAERIRPDLPVRDVAGILRSFDYAAAVGETTDPEWVTDARTAFLTGYQNEQPNSLDSDLLRALELDKALYEVGYESANRPDWVQIPLAGIDRILTESTSS